MSQKHHGDLTKNITSLADRAIAIIAGQTAHPFSASLEGSARPANKMTSAVL